MACPLVAEVIACEQLPKRMPTATGAPRAEPQKAIEAGSRVERAVIRRTARLIATLLAAAVGTALFVLYLTTDFDRLFLFLSSSGLVLFWWAVERSLMLLGRNEAGRSPHSADLP
jgi:hypothetical protein